MHAVADGSLIARRLFKKAAFSPAQPRRAKTRRSAGKAATGMLLLNVSRFTSHVSRICRTKPADFFNSLLKAEAETKQQGNTCMVILR